MRKCALLFKRHRKMLSPVSGRPFTLVTQGVLRQHANKKKFSSPYWVTAGQASRVFGTIPAFGQQPVSTFFGVRAVYKLSDIATEQAAYIMRTSPPYFNDGVGVLAGDTGDWKLIGQNELRQRLLDEAGDERPLFVDEAYVKQKGLNIVTASQPTVVSDFCRISLYNADQMIQPMRCKPLRGLAISAATGMRFPQPAHDTLVSAAVLFGCVSPLWMTKSQAVKLFHTRLVYRRGVDVPTARGLAAPLVCLPPSIQQVIQGRPLVDQVAHSNFWLYSHTGWMELRQTSFGRHTVLTAMSKIQAAKNLGANGNLWVDLNVLDSCLEDQATTAALLFQDEYIDMPLVSITDLSHQTFYNVECAENPSACCPKSQPMIIANGRPAVHYERESLLKSILAKEKRYTSPIWLDSKHAKLLGVAIKDEELDSGLIRSRHYVYPVQEFYGLSDFTDQEAVFREFPFSGADIHGKPGSVPAAEQHQMLYVSWRPVVGTARLSFLDSVHAMRPNPSRLWISRSDSVHFTKYLKRGAVMHSFPPPKECRVGRPLYNSEQTTDPVRVLALSRFRTKGVHSGSI